MPRWFHRQTRSSWTFDSENSRQWNCKKSSATGLFFEEMDILKWLLWLVKSHFYPCHGTRELIAVTYGWFMDDSWMWTPRVNQSTNEMINSQALHSYHRSTRNSSRFNLKVTVGCHTKLQSIQSSYFFAIKNMHILKFQWIQKNALGLHPKLPVNQSTSQPRFLRGTDVRDVETGSIADVHEHHAQGNVDQGLVEERGMGIGDLSANRSGPTETQNSLTEHGQPLGHGRTMSFTMKNMGTWELWRF